MKELLDQQLAVNKNGKYFVFADKTNLELPDWRRKLDPTWVKRMMYLDSEVVPGAELYCEVVWFLPGRPLPKGGEKQGLLEHSHDFGELIGFFGFNYENIHDLGAEVEISIDGQPYNIKETFVAYIPPGVKHGPLAIRNIIRPVMHLTAGPAKKYF
jgi:hypothetical protein